MLVHYSGISVLLLRFRRLALQRRSSAACAAGDFTLQRSEDREDLAFIRLASRAFQRPLMRVRRRGILKASSLEESERFHA